MNPEEIGRILDEIGQRIGPAGEYAWTISVRQVVIESVAGCVVSVLLLFASVIVALVLWRWHRWYVVQPDYSTGDDVRGSWWGALAIGIPIWSIPLADNLTQLLNPEYHAMIRLLERLVPS